MAYLWPSSLVPWLDPCGDPYSGAKAYFFNAGTTTPKTTFSNSGLSTPHDHPVVASGSGRFPAIFLNGGDFRVRIVTADGVTIEDVDGVSIPQIGSGGGGGGDTPQELLARTGDIKARYSIGAHSGWVRANARTIGNGLSGATERANDDCQALFELLWEEDPTLEVSGGRGASATSDWAANKTISLPDIRGRAIFGLAGMGNIAVNRIPSALLDEDNDTLGAVGGQGEVSLTVPQLPAHSHTGKTKLGGRHRHGFIRGGGAGSVFRLHAQTNGVQSTQDTLEGGEHDHELEINNTGQGGAHSNLPPALLATVYIKL